MLALLCRMLHIENDDFTCSFVDRVVDEIRIFTRDKLAHAFCLLGAANVWKQNKILQTFIDCRTDALRSGRVSLPNVVSDSRNIFDSALREPQLHRSKRRNAASTSASVANCRRFA